MRLDYGHFPIAGRIFRSQGRHQRRIRPQDSLSGQDPRPLVRDSDGANQRQAQNLIPKFGDKLTCQHPSKGIAQNCELLSPEFVSNEGRNRISNGVSAVDLRSGRRLPHSRQVKVDPQPITTLSKHWVEPQQQMMIDAKAMNDQDRGPRPVLNRMHFRTLASRRS